MLYWLHRCDGGRNINKEANFCATMALLSPPPTPQRSSLYPILCPPAFESLLTSSPLISFNHPPHTLFDYLPKSRIQGHNLSI